ncbi:hypothetical protein CCACVL1_13456 [Corchorus capsularis]|uniref:Uncharacterized protein n=1 Tax=Corchorus capsularis TaxID=210143 RepID=A0A1R3IAT3_COCAP|nr:hypothetical protein CCACVL1_13456 [Corchorus capsularis]
MKGGTRGNVAYASIHNSWHMYSDQPLRRADHRPFKKLSPSVPTDASTDANKPRRRVSGPPGPSVPVDFVG